MDEKKAEEKRWIVEWESGRYSYNKSFATIDEALQLQREKLNDGKAATIRKIEEENGDNKELTLEELRASWERNERGIDRPGKITEAERVGKAFDEYTRREE